MESTNKIQKIVIVDFGGQYAHLIASRIRRLGVFSEIFQNDCKPEDFQNNNVRGIILSGGPSSISDANAPKIDEKIFNLGIPLLGLCYGHQYIARSFGGDVSQGKHREYGIAKLMITKNVNSPLFKGLSEDGEQMWMSHGDSVDVIGNGFQNIGSTSNCQNAALQNLEKKIFTLQFHPEVTHSIKGMTVLQNFVEICGCQKSWDPKQYTEILKEACKNKILSTKSKVFMLVSGGVDSTVAFTLLNNALGKENVYGLFIDNGLLRKDEFNNVNNAIKQLGFDNFHGEDCQQLFLDRLKEQYDPEKKRIIIGNTFIDAQKKVLDNLKLNPDEWILGQGTIYPDTIESKGTKNADLIKTHHNRVEIIQTMIEQGKIIEPLMNLYKDEVRAVGLELGLPGSIVWRHPFPGPGLGVRCLCNYQENDEVIPNEKDININLNQITSKFNIFSQILPVRSVGVQGDSRTYSHPAVLYIDNEEIQQKHSWKELEEISTTITNQIKAVNRVILLISSKNYKQFPTTKKTLHKLYITKQRLDVLREADDIAMNTLTKYNLMQKVWQMPTILLPYGSNQDESIILRPIFSSEAMTAEFAKLDFSIIKEISNSILQKLNGISEVYFDITNKPPSTIEWE